MVGGIVLDNHNVNNSPLLKFAVEPEPRCETGEQAGERGLAHLRRAAPQVFQPRALDQLCACGFDGDPTSAPENTTPQKIPRCGVSSLDKSCELELANLSLFWRLRPSG
jgi:hypothetical protein